MRDEIADIIADALVKKMGDRLEAAIERALPGAVANVLYGLLPKEMTNAMLENEREMSVDQVRQFCRCGRPTLDRALADGTLPHRRSGKNNRAIITLGDAIVFKRKYIE